MLSKLIRLNHSLTNAKSQQFNGPWDITIQYITVYYNIRYIPAIEIGWRCVVPPQHRSWLSPVSDRNRGWPVFILRNWTRLPSCMFMGSDSLKSAFIWISSNPFIISRYGSNERAKNFLTSCRSALSFLHVFTNRNAWTLRRWLERCGTGRQTYEYLEKTSPKLTQAPSSKPGRLSQFCSLGCHVLAYTRLKLKIWLKRPE